MFLIFYKVLSYLIFPILLLVIFYRKLINKEDPIRYKEKFLIYSSNQAKIRSMKTYGANVGTCMNGWIGWCVAAYKSECIHFCIDDNFSYFEMTWQSIFQGLLAKCD